MSERIIEVKDLEYKYGDFKAVEGVSFFVREGEIFSFLGPNGAGKSTVINILTTLLPVQKGSRHHCRIRPGKRAARGAPLHRHRLSG